MSLPVRTTVPAPLPSRQPPPLEQGDHLSWSEFERRYDAMPKVKKAELLEGVVHMSSPVRIFNHSGPHSTFQTWLGFYRGFTPGTYAGDNGTVRLDDKNAPQPDGMLFILHGGQARVDKDDYLAGSPELAGEVASSSVSIDMHQKKRIYQKFGVKEYIIWRVDDREVDWFKLVNNDFVPLPRHESGQLRSEVFPGLWLDVAALVDENWPQLMAVLQQGLASPEHAAFVARLAAQTPPPPATQG
jgi:Uma2 family endonuclease